VPTRNVLIVDPNHNFSQILHENLEQAGSYVVTTASSGAEAAEITHEGAFDLAILDTMLQDVAPQDLLFALREIDPYLRIAFIPPFGEELDSALAELDIQGILSKPFIVRRLDSQIQSFLQQEVLTAPPSRADSLRERMDEIRPLLDGLDREVSSQIIALICDRELVFYVARPPYDDEDALVPLIEDSFEVSARLAAFLGEEKDHLHLTSYVGERLSLYALSFADGLVVVTVPGEHVPPGVVHLGIKRVVEEISELLPED
jgi:CheY-like chemotaxis protein